MKCFLPPCFPKLQRYWSKQFNDIWSPYRRECFVGHHALKTATNTSLLWTWSIPERKPQAGFNRAIMHWQNAFSLTTTVSGISSKRAINTRGNLVFRWRFYHPKQSLNFLPCFLFACIFHFVFSFPFLIYRQLVRKEVFSVVGWNIANCS